LFVLGLRWQRCWASGAGGTLVSEQVPQGEQSVQYRDSLAAAAPQMAVPIDPGQSQISVSVTVRWSLR